MYDESASCNDEKIVKRFLSIDALKTVYRMDTH